MVTDVTLRNTNPAMTLKEACIAVLCYKKHNKKREKKESIWWLRHPTNGSAFRFLLFWQAQKWLPLEALELLIWPLTAICFIRAVTAVKYEVTSLGSVVAGPVSTPQLCTLRVIWKIKSSSRQCLAFKSAWQLCPFQLLEVWKAWRMGRIRDQNLTPPP